MKAVDSAGNESPVVTHIWSVEGPFTTIVTTPAAVTNQQTATFTFTATGAGVTHECKLDSDAGTGIEYADCDSDTGVTYNNIAAGSRTFYVRGTDTHGNVEITAKEYSWTIGK
jgi:hypothetical protein